MRGVVPTLRPRQVGETGSDAAAAGAGSRRTRTPSDGTRASPWRIPEATGDDLEGGVEAWLAAGLTIGRGPADVRL